MRCESNIQRENMAEFTSCVTTRSGWLGKRRAEDTIFVHSTAVQTHSIVGNYMGTGGIHSWAGVKCSNNIVWNDSRCMNRRWTSSDDTPTTSWIEATDGTSGTRSIYISVNLADLFTEMILTSCVGGGRRRWSLISNSLFILSSIETLRIIIKTWDWVLVLRMYWRLLTVTVG